jgi:hypothetical protein
VFPVCFITKFLPDKWFPELGKKKKKKNAKGTVSPNEAGENTIIEREEIEVEKRNEDV